MDYQRECGSIQADLARRAGSLLQQYRTLKSKVAEDERYDATLAMSVLGLLLVNCSEAIEVLKKDSRDSHLWSLVGTKVITHSTSNLPPSRNKTTEEHAFSQLRNAVSHPVPTGRGKYAVTGYTSYATKSPSPKVAGFTFVASPWAATPQSLVSVGSDWGALKSLLGRFRKSYDCDGMLEICALDHGQIAILSVETGEPYVPSFSVTLDLPQVEDLALSLANYLAHAHESNHGWDGSELRDLVAV